MKFQTNVEAKVKLNDTLVKNSKSSIHRFSGSIPDFKNAKFSVDHPICIKLKIEIVHLVQLRITYSKF